MQHKIWGEGIVLRYEGDNMILPFDHVGYKTLSVQLVMQRALLQPLLEQEK